MMNMVFLVHFILLSKIKQECFRSTVLTKPIQYIVLEQDDALRCQLVFPILIWMLEETGLSKSPVF